MYAEKQENGGVTYSNSTQLLYLRKLVWGLQLWRAGLLRARINTRTIVERIKSDRSIVAKSFAALILALWCSGVSALECETVDGIAEKHAGFEVVKITPAEELDNGRAILVLHELTGLGKKTKCLGDLLAKKGYTVYLPVLFGKRLFLKNAIALAFNSDWTPYRTQTSPVVDRLVTLAGEISMLHEGRQIGVVGLCISGILPIPMLKSDSVAAVIVSQPSIPLLALTNKRKASPGVSEHDLRMAVDSTVPILGFRFYGDWKSPGQRFSTLKSKFGDQFIDCQVTESEMAKYQIEKGAHAVLTAELFGDKPHPSKIRFDTTVTYLDERLLGNGDVTNTRLTCKLLLESS